MCEMDVIADLQDNLVCHIVREQYTTVRQFQKAGFQLHG
jgi:hypothetical protein